MSEKIKIFREEIISMLNEADALIKDGDVGKGILKRFEARGRMIDEGVIFVSDDKYRDAYPDGFEEAVRRGDYDNEFDAIYWQQKDHEKEAERLIEKQESQNIADIADGYSKVSTDMFKWGYSVDDISKMLIQNILQIKDKQKQEAIIARLSITSENINWFESAMLEVKRFFNILFNKDKIKNTEVGKKSFSEITKEAIEKAKENNKSQESEILSGLDPAI